MLDDVDLLVCGAGPAGCVVAERAASVLGWKVLVVDRRAFDTIIQRGDVGDKLYLIERGRVEVSVPGPLGDQVLDTLHDGDYFGEIALLLDVPRTANVWALGPCNLLVLSKADFQTLVQRLPRVAEQLSPVIQERLAAQQGQPTALAARGTTGEQSGDPASPRG